MGNKNPYFRQVELLVRILPLVGESPCFALKGGTAINLFYRDMPRLSIDIDLVYVPVRERMQSLDEMTISLKSMGDAIVARLPNARIQYSQMNRTRHINRLIVEADRAVVKIELSPVLRGTVYEPAFMRITRTAEKAFGFAEVRVVSFEDLFAGKMIAALDRQHPRDLFDIKGLLEHEGITDRLKETFIVYLISHNRRIVEILDPSLIDIKQMYEIDFVGMTTNPITLADLIDVKSDLIRTVHGLLDERDKKFLVDFKAGYPNWSYFSVPHIKDLPAVRWKLYNLDQVDIPKRQQMVDRLKAFLAPL
ncbi:MAG: nucleotidyl transferase AbiEii/AbiGii toxin family protein [Sphaerochaeta associata]|uniref:nucleotidyl transferase AbiEii/AbiGii toxin family protein n=1 Tax=Sphaerochaeta associata TaxID=1129264 RepID=UPI002B2058D8|nr:nucleotidyl transferase AbiEii/AbiGii toxin family protein [Sphaerochaeta associata]MEA5108386.1 nucleotidyl transferase AbiEii/AbiGii toxin family protein [Sphaerochaeta associata]